MLGTHSKIVLVAAVALASQGCATRALMPTPNIYVSPGAYPAAQIPDGLRSALVDVLYLTDRRLDQGESPDVRYGSGRSASVAFGSVEVALGEGESWEDLLAASGERSRKHELKLRVEAPKPLGRFPDTPRPFVVKDGVVSEPEASVAALEAARAEFREALGARLALTPRKEVLLYVHGFNNSFEDAVFALAEMWHFLGRGGVPIAYSWPAASGGLRGYFVDRESGEFTVYHLKEALRMLASFPEVEKIHILAHSRGTDITTTALRELVIETRASGKNPLLALRIENLILAAPDLDLDVVRQRLIAEKFGPAFGQITIYTTQTDKALDASQTLMTGTRFGRVQSSDLGETEKKIFSSVNNVHFIEVEGVKSFVSHDYFRTNPATSSDIIRILRRADRPGDASRPLEHKMLNFWEMPAGYPRQSGD